MSNEDLAALVSAVILLVYVLGLVGALGRQVVRFVGYRFGVVLLHLDRRPWRGWSIGHIPREPVPNLLKRDIWFVFGLAWPFLAILTVRVGTTSGYLDPASFTGNVGWYLVTGVPAVVAVLAYLYYELFKIERPEVEERKRRWRRHIT